MISKKLVEATELEARKLRENITVDEAARLDFSQLDPEHAERCIYGQIAGNCVSKRAIELIEKCAPFSINMRKNNTKPVRVEEAWDTSCTFEPEKTSNVLERSVWAIDYFSPIETYITQEGADNEQLVDFIKGEIAEIDLSATVNC